MALIQHPTAIVSSKAKIEDNVKIGPYCIINDDVYISEGTELIANVYLDNGAQIGKNCLLFPGATIATKPQDLKYDNSPTKAIIGDNNEIREFVTIHRGTQHTGATIVGNNNLIMAYCHIAHDCRVGNNNIFANVVQLAGHVTVEDWVVIGGVVKVHQFCKIGAHAMVGGDVKVTKDIPPYTLVADNPAKVNGINKVGLKRRGFTQEVIKELENFYKLIFHSGFNNTDGIQKYIETHPNGILPEIQHCIEFIKSSERGVYR
ncbi:MAG: Acyl-[acyl-carrier-protein]--UDP-N-acetylglucosamine O-acyltransferase [Candidatus Kapaibacterium sp.]|nr:MAG: Acyl-[acyl-carrier-protein]--UDP-N-acetylglucosamine O-acyltransferase [Candidatus Kapabacteria bacterium]